MEVLAFLHHSLAYEHPEDYELQLSWDELQTISSTILPEIVLPNLQFSGQLSSQTAGYLLCLLGGLAILAASESASATTLARGSYGDDVRELQYALNQAGYFHGPFTGFFGSLTQAAVMNFQYDHALAVDGIAGHNTLSALQVSSAPVGGGNLSYGMYGSEVTDLQYSLANAGYFNGPFTGYFGELTEAAVMALQRDYGLTVDGIVGPNTRAALAGAATPAAPQAATGSQTLRYGSTGPAVTQLQRDLASAGFYAGPFTQYYGNQTQRAVIDFQAAHGLAQDGIAGPTTQSTLAQVLAGTPPAIAARPEPTPPPQVTPPPVETPTPEPSEPIVTQPSPSPTPSASPIPEPTATATPEPTAVVTPEPTPTNTVSETPGDGGPLPAGFIELQSNLQAYASPSLDSEPIDSGYPLNAGQILGYAEDQGDGWIRIVGAGNGEDAWIYAGADYSGVEFRTSSQPSTEPTTSPELSLRPSPQPEETSTVVPTPKPTANAPENFFIGPSSVELSQTLTTYDVPGGTAQNLSFSAGEKLTYVGARPDCWVQVKNPSGQSTWVYAGENFSAVTFVNEGAFVDIQVDPPTCAPTGTAP